MPARQEFEQPGEPHERVETAGDHIAGDQIVMGDVVYGDKVAGDKISVFQRINNFFVSDNQAQRDLRNRLNMLKLMHNTWIQGVLKKMLPNQALIQLHLQAQPEAVTDPWEPLIAIPEQAAMLPVDAQILELLEQANGTLLILGAPGSGKTTLLLELARQAIERAEQDLSQPIPVIFNLSSWRSKRKLAEWLAAELNSKYFIPPEQAQNWVNNNDILPLLDGLDEVNEQDREACVEAINALRKEKGMSMAVCCRAAEYRAIPVKLALSGAAEVLQLDEAQIDGYLAQAEIDEDGNERGDLNGLRQALREDTDLHELAQSPLMLSLMQVAYRGIPYEDLDTAQEKSVQQQRLLELYVQRVFARQARSKQARYPQEQTLHGMAWLARHMLVQQQTIFTLEALNAGWFSRGWLRLAQRGLAGFLAGFCAGAVIGFGVGLVGGMTYGVGIGLLASIASGLQYGLVGALSGVVSAWLGGWAGNKFLRGGLGLILGAGIGGISGALLAAQYFASAGLFLGSLIGGLSGGLAATLRTAPTEQLVWSWRKARAGWPGGAGLGAMLAIAMWLLLGMISGFVGWRVEMQCATSGALGGALIGALISGLTSGLESAVIQTRSYPGQGLYSSQRNSLSLLLFGGLAGALIGALGAGLGSALFLWMMTQLGGQLANIVWIFWPLVGLLAGALGGLLIGFMRYGGGYTIYHWSVRVLLCREAKLPLRLSDFLDYASEQILLCKVGGGYLFIHRLLMEYFAGLEGIQGQAPEPKKFRNK